MSDLAFLPAHELARRLRRGELSALELLDHYLGRIGRIGGPINAVVVLDADRARQRARAADAVLARGEIWGPLHGLPITVKESFNVAGLPTTYGFATHARNIATSDALLVQRLQAAGAVLFGKTALASSRSEGHIVIFPARFLRCLGLLLDLQFGRLDEADRRRDVVEDQQAFLVVQDGVVVREALVVADIVERLQH